MKNKNAIQISDLTRKFGQLTAVDKVRFDIKQGELFSLLGPNGAGKTTLIKMLCCLLRPTQGTARVLGNDISQNLEAIKPIINIAPQETAIAGKLTAIENLMMMARIYGCPKPEAKKRATNLIELMRLQERAHDKVENFSGGMQRRMNMALALVSDPKVLFLDEPTLGLDPEARQDLWKEIRQITGEKTIVMTTHYLEEADFLSDRIGIIKEGQMVAIGAQDELRKKFQLQQSMNIRAKKVSPKAIQALSKQYSKIKKTPTGVQIEGKKLNFNVIIDSLRSNGVDIEWLCMEEPSLEEIYLNIIEGKR